MAAKTIVPDVFHIGVNHWDRQIFDSLIPLPHGTSYNSYVVKGSEKTALIDTAEHEKHDEFFCNLSLLDIGKIDYIISLHAEQDHSALIPEVLKKYPGAKVVTNTKVKDLLIAFMNLPEDAFVVVNDRELLHLGGKTLDFIMAPWVHWPDTMFAYLKEDKILFSTDFFGAHASYSSITVDDSCRAYDGAKRYYAQIMMPFRNNVMANLKKAEELGPAMIAPSHGQMYNNPSFIMDAYRDWSSDKVSNEVVLPYVTMHGSTKKMAEYLVEKLLARNINVKPFNLETADSGELAMALVNAATVIIGSPAVLVGAHPKAVYAAFLVNALKPKTKFLGIIGSYGWGSKLAESLGSLLSGMKCEMFDPVIIKGFPLEKDFEELDKLAIKVSDAHKRLGIL